LSFTVSGSASYDVINSQDHLSGFSSRDESLLLYSKALSDTEFFHGLHFSLVHVESSVSLSVGDAGSKVGNELSRVVPGVISDNSGELTESTGKGLDGDGLLAFHSLSKIVNSKRHSHLGVTSTVDDLVVLDSSHEHTDGIMERSVSLIKDVSARSSEDDGASLVTLASSELDDLVFTDHNLFNGIACAEGVDLIGLVEGGQNVRSEDGGKSLNSVEVSVLDDHNALLGKELLGVVVDELSVDENVGLVGQDALHFIEHLLLLGGFNLTNSAHGVDLNFSAHNFDFIVIHGSVGDHNSAVFGGLVASSGDALLEDETIGDEGVSEGTTGLLDNLDVIKVSSSLESHDGLDGEVGELLSIVEEELGGEGGEGDVLEILGERSLIGEMVHRDVVENLLGDGSSSSPSLDDDLGVDFLVDELFSLLEELSSHDGDGGGTISDLLVLSLGDVDQNFGGRVINPDGLEDSGTIVGDGDLLASVLVSHGLENLIHTLGSEGSLDEVSNGNGSNE